ncbi:hypothetical protein B0J13DRAFT_677715 [Dactylonectria estremocensis]|uniref:Major facilitator superfamily (MFS) profile domain-containing protein n=1 Tax=Dactylonectria estremocensis TaxID=1079267 RepID=A0A9P9EHW4_9HYPO|nr:hypothetical protein B0J13DRAFT_677715 [Dactylonectria estremocensis]
MAWTSQMDPKARVLICCRDKCKYTLSVDDSNVTTHLWDKRDIPGEARKGLTKFLKSLGLCGPDKGFFYATVGFTGKTSLLFSGIYGMMGIIGQTIYLVVVADRWPRARTLWTDSVVLSVMISICMALSARFGSVEAENPAGARGAIAMIFLYSASYAIFFNAMIWVVPSELFPFFLRSKGLAFAVFCKATVGIVLSQITPIALANVSWRYYSLFIATNLTAAIIYFFFLPETSGKSLEEIAELFGDVVATASDKKTGVEDGVTEWQNVEHLGRDKAKSEI